MEIKKQGAMLDRALFYTIKTAFCTAKYKFFRFCVTNFFVFPEGTEEKIENIYILKIKRIMNMSSSKHISCILWNIMT
jgi:hypothetical protein